MNKKLIFLITSFSLSLLFIAGMGFSNLDPDNWTNVYQTVEVQKDIMQEYCTDEIHEANLTVHPEYCWEVVIGWYPENKTTGKVIGITDGNEIIYNAYKHGNGKISKFKVPIGDRNFDDPALGNGCMPHEIRKGVCELG